MTSIAQIEANRKNAQKSTGPKTESGKQRSSQNALTHGLFASIPILPGEDKEAMTALADAINQTYQPQDAMELVLVERIIMASFRQVRLREAEAANVKISMTPKHIANNLNQALKMPFTEQLTPEDLTPEMESHFQCCKEILREIGESDYLNTLLSIETIEATMPNTYKFLQGKPRNFKMDWFDFIKDPHLIRKAISDIKLDLEKYIRISQGKHTAYHLIEDMKALQRIPQLKDMALFSKYQTQFDNDLYRAMNQLEKYSSGKSKIIDVEVVDEIAA